MSRHESAAAIPPHVLERADMQDALARHDFGAVFALARKWAGISYSRIAEACAIKPERVGTLARGMGSITTYEKITLIAEALHIPGHMLGLAPRGWELHSANPRNASTQIVDGPDRSNEDPLQRRDFLRITALGAGLAIGGDDRLRGTTARRLDANVPVRLRERTARLRKLDDVLGGGDTFPLYLSEYRRTEALLREGTYTESTGRALLSILAEQAQQAGWAAFDAGDHDQAVKLYEASRHAAMQAGNAPLAGNALAFLAYQQLGADRSAALRTAVESCCAAGTDAPGGVRALLYERLAWAYALSGNAPETERALETARAGLADAAVEPQPDWTTWVDHNELQIMTGRCWAELRRPLRAAPVLENVLAAFDDTHARDKALYMSWLADAYLAAREIEQAVATIGRALELSAGVASVRPRQRLSPAIEQLRAHSDLPAVRDVLEFADSSS